MLTLQCVLRPQLTLWVHWGAIAQRGDLGLRFPKRRVPQYLDGFISWNIPFLNGWSKGAAPPRPQLFGFGPGVRPLRRAPQLVSPQRLGAPGCGGSTRWRLGGPLLRPREGAAAGASDLAQGPGKSWGNRKLGTVSPIKSQGFLCMFLSTNPMLYGS